MLRSKKTRSLCLLLMLVLVLPLALTACGGDGSGTGTTAATTIGGNGTQATTGATQGTQEQEEIIDPEVEDWVEIYDMGIDGGARKITLVTDKDYNTNLYLFRHEDDGDVLAGDALAISASTRTLFVEEQFNVAFEAREYNGGALYSFIQSSLMGNGGEIDLVYPHPTAYMLNYLSEGLFQNLYNFDAIDLSKPWWNQSEVREFSVDDKLYIAVNDMSISGQGFLSIIYNRDLYNELQMTEDVYSLVYDGEWTMAKLGELAMNFGEGAGADGVLNLNDKIGYALHQHNLYWGAGGRVISKDATGAFYLAIDADQADLITSEWYKLLWETEEHVWKVEESYSYATFGSTQTLAAFKGGTILFWSYDLGGLYKHLWNVTFDIGYLPAPKVNRDQEAYYSVCSAGFLAIPQKAKDNKVSSTLLEALAIHSYTNHRKNFFENILLSRMSEKPEDYKMLTFIHETKVFDWGSHLFVTSDSNVFVEMAVNQKSNSVQNMVKGRKKAWEKLLLNIEQIRTGEFEG